MFPDSTKINQWILIKEKKKKVVQFGAELINCELKSNFIRGLFGLGRGMCAMSHYSHVTTLILNRLPFSEGATESDKLGRT